MQDAKDEGSAARVGGSKKDPTVRRREILGQGPESLAHALTETAAANAATLLQSMLGSDVLVEAACGGEAGECAFAAPVSPSMRCDVSTLPAYASDSPPPHSRGQRCPSWWRPGPCWSAVMLKDCINLQECWVS